MRSLQTWCTQLLITWHYKIVGKILMKSMNRSVFVAKLFLLLHFFLCKTKISPIRACIWIWSVSQYIMSRHWKRTCPKSPMPTTILVACSKRAHWSTIIQNVATHYSQARTQKHETRQVLSAWHSAINVLRELVITKRKVFEVIAPEVSKIVKKIGCTCA